MALTFRYRFVDFGTAFIGDHRFREAGNESDSPATLFANELVTDVGGTCWGNNEPLPILDHHFSAEGQFPSASAAVLHKAKLIREKFAQQEHQVVWLVTHKVPDFDAFCSLYLARCIIESSDTSDWQTCGLHPDGWFDLADRAKIDWFNPDLSRASMAQRWPLLLAAYASALDDRRHISCPRQRALNSVLGAALKRGRDYQTATSGAIEFFDEVRRCLQQSRLNPLFDSVLENSELFAPELALLDREAVAYERDLRRARQSIVYLPQSEAPSPSFFKTPKQVALLQELGMAQEVDAQNLLLADTFRIPTDGIYLRDPECLLFQEWVRVDLENSSLGKGFEFTAIADSNGRPAGTVNQTDYIFSLDPERANGRHLYTVWSRLQTRRVHELQAHEARAAALDRLASDPWIGGPNSAGTLVRTPQRGTTIGPPGRLSDLRDDPVAEEVRAELEYPVYSPESLTAGPQFTVIDLAGSKGLQDKAARKFTLDPPQQVPPAQDGFFRFAVIHLRADVAIVSGEISAGRPVPTSRAEGSELDTPVSSNVPWRRRGVLAEQIGETLWRILYPDAPGSLPPDFAEAHLVITPDSCAVWADRGIAVAQKQSLALDAHSSSDRQPIPLADDFAGMVSLVRDIDQLTADAQRFNNLSLDKSGMAGSSAPYSAAASLAAVVTQCEQLVERGVQVEHVLTLPGRDVLRRFADAIRIGQLLATLRDLNSAVTEELRLRQSAEQAKRIDERANLIAKLRSRLEWLEVFILGFFAAQITEVITRLYGVGDMAGRALVSLSGPMVIGLAAWILKPWKRKPIAADTLVASQSILVGLIAACVVAWLSSLLPIWSK